uniref:Protein ABIL1 n=1 Tax=Quercus lobata TaxID=97700 RepID=A0A7N2LHN5_QUELO
MEVEQSRAVNPAMTFDEVSMERSKNFVKALQELKNLRPQLYSAAEYCEKSYLHSEQKQMVLDNLKDYAVRALVNAVDHLGTVAYKLTDLLEQQTLEVSTMELNVSCLNQKLLMCQTYTEKEGIRQQQLLAFIPRHHKHYILPNSVNKKVHFSPQIQTDARQNHFQARARLYPSGMYFCIKNSFLAFSLRNEVYHEGDPAIFEQLALGQEIYGKITEDLKISGNTSGVFHLVDNEETIKTKSSAAHLQLPSGGPGSSAVMQTLSATRRFCSRTISIVFEYSARAGGDVDLAQEIMHIKQLTLSDATDSSKALTSYRSFENRNRREIVRVPVRSKSVLSAFFVKQKTPKLKAGSDP